MSTRARSRPTVARPAPAEVLPEQVQPRRNYARWRALSLSLVYLVFAAHILHWKLTGKTLAPLELNEVMYTLELGIITAGFLFMCFLALGTLIFGRFFCSWACHIMVLQDLCAWLLRKLGIRRKAVRSRVWLLIPPLTAFYMFIWPQIVRAWHSRAFPDFHFRTDAEGWASFVTNNFWRNLPSAPIIVLTFLVCGFLIVYLMGTRTFCTYVCPYGAIFALADRFSPARIRTRPDRCQQCGTCTAACTSSVRVHEETKRHGMVVNPACMKDLDCVAACPHDALYYGFGRPALFKSHTSGGRFGLPYDFTRSEDVLMGLVFLVVLLSFRGLYSRLPFLLSLALGAVVGYLAVMAVRTVSRPDVKLATLWLKQSGQVTATGRLYQLFVVLLAAFVGHSAFVRYHEYSGLKQALAMGGAANEERRQALAAGAHAHLLTADRWGLISNERVERSLVQTSLHLNRPSDTQVYAYRLLDRYPSDRWVRLQLAQSLIAVDRGPEAEQHLRTVLAQGADADEPSPSPRVKAHKALAGLLGRRGEYAAAVDELHAALTLKPQAADLHAELGSFLAELARVAMSSDPDRAAQHLEDALAALREAVRLDPALADAHYNLGTILAHTNRFAEAIPHYRRAVELSPDDPGLRNNLAFALLRTGRLPEAREHLERAVTLDPQNADAHFNLGRLFASLHQEREAAEHLSAAARLDPRYAGLLGHE